MTAPKPPKTKVRTRTTTHHGYKLADPYAWLKDKNYPEVKDKEILGYLEAENVYAEAVLRPLKKQIETLFKEMKGRIAEEDTGVPVKDGPFLYSWAYAKGTQYRIWKRKPARGGTWQTIFDENKRAKGLEFYKLGALARSPDHKLLAVTEDMDGSERFKLRIKNLKTGRFLKDEIPETLGSPVWSADGEWLFYAVVNENWRPWQIKRHRLGDDPKHDIVVYEEHDTSFFVGVGKTHSRKFIIVSSGDHVTSEIRVIPAARPDAKPLLMAKRKKNHHYLVDHGEGKFFISTNDTHKNFRVVTAPEDSPHRNNWKQLVAPSDSNYIRGLQVFKDFLVIQERKNGVDRIRIKFHGGGQHHIDFPEQVYMADPGATHEYDTPTVRIVYESMITPETVYDYDVTKKKLITRKVQKIPSGYRKADYRTKRLMAPGRDGTKVPVTLLYRKDMKRDGKNPLHLYGYGAYGMGMPPWFSTTAFSLVDRGFVYAIAHIRGGDEMGYQWYEDGKLKKRLNTFHDFIDVARFLIGEGYTYEGGISIEGRSAGGELMGYVLNAAPELWRAALVGVPFVDVLNTMLDDSLPLTPMEWPEWGNPITDKAAFRLIRSYSPYDNITKQAYPAQFVSGGLNDPRVTYWEPAKWTARVRANNTAGTTIVLKTNMGAGHGGKSGRFTRLEERAEEYAFILDQFGLASD